MQSHYLFIYLYLKKKSALVQVISYQLFDLLSLELKSHVLENNSLFSPEQLICAVGDLTMRNLAYLNDSIRLSLVSTEFLLFIYFSCWVQGLLVLGYCPSSYVTLQGFHVVPEFQELAKQTIISFASCLQGIRLTDL
jgi:hypothetical protein